MHTGVSSSFLTCPYLDFSLASTAYRVTMSIGLLTASDAQTEDAFYQTTIEDQLD
jgi:hypothetical protein